LSDGQEGFSIVLPTFVRRMAGLHACAGFDEEA
jgi:hypothetical protein